MTLQLSGPISIDDIRAEIGLDAGSELSLQTAAELLLGASDSAPVAVSISDFYGASAGVALAWEERIDYAGLTATIIPSLTPAQLGWFVAGNWSVGYLHALAPAIAAIDLTQNFLVVEAFSPTLLTTTANIAFKTTSDPTSLPSLFPTIGTSSSSIVARDGGYLYTDAVSLASVSGDIDSAQPNFTFVIIGGAPSYYIKDIYSSATDPTIGASIELINSLFTVSRLSNTGALADFTEADVAEAGDIVLATVDGLDSLSIDNGGVWAGRNYLLTTDFLLSGDFTLSFDVNIIDPPPITYYGVIVSFETGVDGGGGFNIVYSRNGNDLVLFVDGVVIDRQALAINTWGSVEVVCTAGVITLTTRTSAAATGTKPTAMSTVARPFHVAGLDETIYTARGSRSQCDFAIRSLVLESSLPLFNDTDWTAVVDGSDTIGTWTNDGTRLAWIAQQGTSMGGGSWIDPFTGVQTNSAAGLEGSAGNTVTISGDYTTGGFEDLVIYAETSDSEYFSVSASGFSGSTWSQAIDLTGYTGNLRKISYFSNGAYFPMAISLMVIS